MTNVTVYCKAEIYQRSDGRWGWRLFGHNGAVIAMDASQGYVERFECEEMARRVKSGEYKDCPIVAEP